MWWSTIDLWPARWYGGASTVWWYGVVVRWYGGTVLVSSVVSG